MPSLSTPVCTTVIKLPYANQPTFGNTAIYIPLHLSAPEFDQEYDNVVVPGKLHLRRTASAIPLRIHVTLQCSLEII